MEQLFEPFGGKEDII